MARKMVSQPSTSEISENQARAVHHKRVHYPQDPKVYPQISIQFLQVTHLTRFLPQSLLYTEAAHIALKAPL
jgi:hypothetical protein